MDEAPLIRVPENPIPEGLKAFYIEAVDGAKLRVAFWPCGEAKGSVLLHPGWAEFIEKYIEVAHDLHKRGFNVMIVDPRGQGYSQKFLPSDRRGLVTDFRQFREDYDKYVDLLKTTFKGPYFLMSHSMGGLVTLDWLMHRRADDFSGVMLNAPLTRLFPHPVKRGFVHLLVSLMTRFGAAALQLKGAKEHSMHFETNNLTHDPRRHERFKQLQLKAPEAQAGSPRCGWLNAALRVMSQLARPGSLSFLPFPVLLVSADRDETVDPTHHHKLAELYDRLRLVRIPGARHEVLMESDEYRDQFWVAFDQYVDDRLSEDSSNRPPEDS